MGAGGESGLFAGELETVESCLPQLTQKLAPAMAFVPQFEQNISTPRSTFNLRLLPPSI
jgi:hypothetical protein